MEHSLSSAEYMERADMHDRLASATADPAARTMHRAMAAEYRRRASEANDSFRPGMSGGSIMELSVSAGQQV